MKQFSKKMRPPLWLESTSTERLLRKEALRSINLELDDAKD
jgi:hypothetical protein